MQFLDEAKIYIRSGAGGHGCLSFRREKNIPRGGPDGGNGGRGGSVIFRCVPGLNTLIDFRYQQHFKAQNGGHGMGQNRFGAAAEDLVIDVPVGTQIFTDNREIQMADLTELGEEIVLLKGGEGGLGNAMFKSSTNQAPRKTTDGEDSQDMWVWLQLKLLSDAGLLGLPNAGKSTFMNAVTRAKPKIADYPFTTLKPQLGVVHVNESEFVLADIPGLIAGASQGQGLGHQFLRHIERCGVLLHLMDVTSDMLVEDYQTIVTELNDYEHGLATRPRIVALNKCDVLLPEQVAEQKALLETVCDLPIYTLSAVSGDGTRDVLQALWQGIEGFRASAGEE